MTLYSGIDLHSNNSVVVVLDENDRTVYQKRLPNSLDAIIAAMNSCPEPIAGVAVESTYNWYWLVDGLQDAGFAVHLVNTAAVKQYDGLKHSGDFQDARQLARLLHLGILPEGYIYPREARAVRDLLRKRSQLVRQRTTQILSIQGLLARNLAMEVSGNLVKTWKTSDIKKLGLLPEQVLAIDANLKVMHLLDEQVDRVEKCILSRAKLRPDYKALRTVSGIGEILALTIALETGDINRFAGPGNFASYARTVSTLRESNGKKKGEGNTKCGNKYLSWAFVEAAHFAVRYDPVIQRYYQRKRARTMTAVAIKAVAHKLARACYHIMRGGGPFDADRAFA